MSIGRTARTARTARTVSARSPLPAFVLLALMVPWTAAPAAAQRRANPARSNLRSGAMQAGLAVGAAGVDARTRGSSWDVGPLLGARWRWSGERSGAFVALDVQPFFAAGGTVAGRYRAAWLLPAWEFRAGRAGVRAGLGVGMLRFEEAQFGDRTDFSTLTGVGGSFRLPASFALELAWRRTGFVRGIRSDIWSLQLIRLWPL